MDSPGADDDILALVEEIIGGSSAARLQALTELAVLEADHPAIVKALIRALKDGDVAVRLAIAQALERRGAPAITALVEGLRESRGTQREAILNTIVLIGPPARAAMPLLNALKDDPLVGSLAERALHAIRHGKPLDWHQLFDRLTLSIVLGGVLLAAICEFFSWLGLLSQAKGLGYQIAIAWCALGAYLGVILGLRLGGTLTMRLGGKVVGMTCAAAGAMVGRLVGEVLEPLIQALGQ